MQEAGYGLTEQAFGGNQGRNAADASLLVKFFKNAKLNEGRTSQEGRPIYEDVDYIQIMQPGNKDSIIIRPATKMDKARFAEHYSRYQARQDEEYIEGTLLTDWPGISRAQAEELSFFNIRTVEQLASVSDSNAQNIMGIQLLKNKAVAYLEAAESQAVAEDLQEAKDEIEELKAQVANLTAKLVEPEEE